MKRTSLRMKKRQKDYTLSANSGTGVASKVRYVQEGEDSA